MMRERLIYQQEEGTDDLPTDAPVQTRREAEHLLNILTELIQSCNRDSHSIMTTQAATTVLTTG